MYVIFLKDRDGFEITSDLAPNMKEAKKHAKYLLSPDYARSCETTHENLGTRKVEICETESGDCVWDAFL